MKPMTSQFKRFVISKVFNLNIDGSGQRVPLVAHE